MKPKVNIYKMALLSQGACNVSGLIHSLADYLDEIWEEAKEKGEGTDYVNNHPVVRLMVEQIAFLSKNRDYSECYQICEEMSK